MAVDRRVEYRATLKTGTVFMADLQCLLGLNDFSPLESLS